MSKSAYLEDEFSSRATIRGGILMFQAFDAIDLIKEAQVRRLPILGVDTFRLGESTTEPLIEHMLDLSRKEINLDTNWIEAIRFIEERKDNGFYFEVVIGDMIFYK